MIPKEYIVNVSEGNNYYYNKTAGEHGGSEKENTGRNCVGEKCATYSKYPSVRQGYPKSDDIRCRPETTKRDNRKSRVQAWIKDVLRHTEEQEQEARSKKKTESPKVNRKYQDDLIPLISSRTCAIRSRTYSHKRESSSKKKRRVDKIDEIKRNEINRILGKAVNLDTENWKKKSNKNYDIYSVSSVLVNKNKKPVISKPVDQKEKKQTHGSDVENLFRPIYQNENPIKFVPHTVIVKQVDKPGTSHSLNAEVIRNDTRKTEAVVHKKYQGVNTKEISLSEEWRAKGVDLGWKYPDAPKRKPEKCYTCSDKYEDYAKIIRDTADVRKIYGRENVKAEPTHISRFKVKRTSSSEDVEHVERIILNNSKRKNNNLKYTKELAVKLKLVDTPPHCANKGVTATPLDLDLCMGDKKCREALLKALYESQRDFPSVMDPKKRKINNPSVPKVKIERPYLNKNRPLIIDNQLEDSSKEDDDHVWLVTERSHLTNFYSENEKPRLKNKDSKGNVVAVLKNPTIKTNKSTVLPMKKVSESISRNFCHKKVEDEYCAAVKKARLHATESNLVYKRYSLNPMGCVPRFKQNCVVKQKPRNYNYTGKLDPLPLGPPRVIVDSKKPDQNDSNNTKLRQSVNSAGTPPGTSETLSFPIVPVNDLSKWSTSKPSCCTPPNSVDFPYDSNKCSATQNTSFKDTTIQTDSETTEESIRRHTRDNLTPRHRFGSFEKMHFTESNTSNSTIEHDANKRSHTRANVDKKSFLSAFRHPPSSKKNKSSSRKKRNVRFNIPHLSEI